MTAWAVAVDVVGLSLGVWLALRRPSLRVGVWYVVLVASLATAGTVLVAGGNPFALMRVWCHVLFCVFAPLLMVVGALAWRRSRGVAMALVLVGLAMDVCYWYAVEVEPRALQVNTHAVAAGQALRVAVMADLQTDAIGDYEAEVFRRLDGVRADLVLFAGDYLQVRTQADFDREQPRLRGLFSGLRHRPRLGMFAVHGDSDFDSDRALAGTGVRMLADETARVGGVQVVGLTNLASQRPLSGDVVQAARSFEGLTFVLGHRPDFAIPLVEKGSPTRMICVAGHTHGGQVVVPLFGPPLTLSRIPRQYAAGGVFPLGEAWLAVSRGIGVERDEAPRIRFMCPPEIVVLEVE